MSMTLDRYQTAYNSFYKHPQTPLISPTNQNERGRTQEQNGTKRSCLSASPKYQACYFTHSHSSPYSNGHKNNGFANPNFFSSQVFYDHNYGYVNDMPNSRLLSPVKHDRYRYDNKNEPTLNQERLNASVNEERSIARRIEDENKMRRSCMSSDTKNMACYFEHHHSNPYSNGKKNDHFANPNFFSSQVFYDHNYGYVNDMPNDRLLSPVKNDRYGKSNENKASSYIEERNSDTHSQRGEDRQKKVSIREDRGEYAVRDDRSEASSACADRVCPKCLNKHLANNKKAVCEAEKYYDREQERINAEINRQRNEEEDARKRAEKESRINEAKVIQEKLNNEYNERLERRRSPPREKNTNLNNLFKKQDEIHQKRWELSHLFGSSLKEQMSRNELEKQRERNINSQPYNTSLQVGQRSYNKYLDDPSTVKSVLQKQIDDKTHNQKAEREIEKREALVEDRKNARHYEEMDQKKREREWKQRKELQEAYAHSREENQLQKQEAMMNKSAEKIAIDRGYEQFKKRQQEEESRTRKQLFDYQQSLLNQQQKSSYRRQYEERKHQKEATSFGISGTPKKLYNCGECSGLYEKAHLTKL